MFNRSRFPLMIALVLGLGAAFLLWWRPQEEPAPEERPTEQTDEQVPG